MAIKYIPVVPPHVPGQGMAKLLKHMEFTVKSDKVNFNSDTNVTLFEVPGNIIITGLNVSVLTAFEASGASAAATATIEVPGSTGAVVAWDAGATSTKLETATTAGMSPDTIGAPIKVPSSGGVVAFKQAPGTTTTGQAEVYMSYIYDDTVL